MAQLHTDFYRRYLRPAARPCLGFLVCGVLGTLGMLGIVGVARASARVEVYQATVPLADRSDAAQAAAFEAAMRVVLVRVTGRRTADEDPALAPLRSSARRYVQQFRATSDGELWVAFDGGAIERWLTQTGQPLWGRDRPSTFVWLTEQTGPQAGIVVTADQASELKSAIDAAALTRGIPLVWPSTADLQKNHLDFAGVTGAAPGALAEIAHVRGADGVLVGRASNGSAAASVRWTLLFQDRGSEFAGALEGINRAADTYAATYAASGALAPVDIEVAGIGDLHDYAGVQTYLESLTFVAHVSVESLSGDSVRFRLTTRGGIESLGHAIALSGRMTTLPAGENGIQRFQLHR